jgi:hypothetical protein
MVMGRSWSGGGAMIFLHLLSKNPMCDTRAQILDTKD